MGAVHRSGDAPVNSVLENATVGLKNAKQTRNRVSWSGTVPTQAPPAPRPPEPVVILPPPAPIDTTGRPLLAELVKEGADSNQALVVLKGGEDGGLEWSVRSLLLGQLGRHYTVTTGRRYVPTAEEVVKRWGPTGLRRHVENLREVGGMFDDFVNDGLGYLTRGEAGHFGDWLFRLFMAQVGLQADPADAAINVVQGYFASGDEEAFGHWLSYNLEGKENVRLHPRISGLVFLWFHLHKDLQYVHLKRNGSREDILRDYGISVEEARALLGVRDVNEVSEQQFVNKLLVGPSSTEEAPIGTLRNLI